MLPYRDSRFVKIGLLCFFLIILVYAYFEARAMLYGPVITTPSDAMVVSEPFVRIQGKAENISELRLNGASVSVTEDGVFSEPYLLTAGENYVVLDARDKYGRTRQKTIEIMYTGTDLDFSATSTQERASPE